MKEYEDRQESRPRYCDCRLCDRYVEGWCHYYGARVLSEELGCERAVLRGWVRDGSEKI